MRGRRLPSQGPAKGNVPAFLGIGAAAAVAFIGATSLVLPHVGEAERWLVSALIYAAFVLPVYLLHRRFSFESQVSHRQGLPRYIAVQVLAVCLATVFSWLLHGTGMLPVWLASSLVAVLTAGVNFVAVKVWAFAQRS